MSTAHSPHDLTTALRARSTELREASALLADALTDAANALEETGAPPGESFLSRLRAFHHSLESLRADVGAQSAAAGHAVDLSLVTFDDLDAVIERLEEVHRRRLEVTRYLDGALAVLDSALSIRHADDPEFAPLAPCRTAALEIQQRLRGHASLETPGEAVDLVEGAHPLAALVVLAARPDELNDDAWNRLQELVSATWGRGLATAVTRGRLTLADRKTLGPL